MSLKSLRKKLVRIALKWEKEIGVAPHITSAISEFDAMKLKGIKDEEIIKDSMNKTSVQKGIDFIYGGIRYQVKANRPSFRKNSSVTITAKAKNYDWDVLIWILYDSYFNIVEAYEWRVEDYKKNFHELKQVRPSHLRRGKRLK